VCVCIENMFSALRNVSVQAVVCIYVYVYVYIDGRMCVRYRATLDEYRAAYRGVYRATIGCDSRCV